MSDTQELATRAVVQPGAREELEKLKAQLEEAEQTLEAIRAGGVDALVVYGQGGEQVFTLRGADEPYRIFVEQMNEGAMTVSLDGVILFCNRSFAGMADAPEESIMGSRVEQFLDSDDGAGFGTIVQGAKTRAEMYVMRHGVRLPVQASFSRISGAGEEMMAVTVTDLSAQRAQEDELRRANDELSGFCYSVSHDLRAPLRGIISGANMVLEDYVDDLPSSAFSHLTRIEKSAGYLGRLIDDLLAYSRLSQSTLHRHEIDLSEIARDIVADGAVLDHGTPEWIIEEGLVANGDPRLVRLILENLMSNAAKYSSTREHAVITFGRGEEAFFVRDNGIGFEMTYAERIFRPFERLHTQEQFPGTGIGLANAKRIAAKHGGRVWANSTPGEGSVFFFTLEGESGS
jgi:signal transduction histidine kinase